MPVNRRSIYPSLGLLLLTLVALSPALRPGFSTFDDFKWIGGNPALQPESRAADLLPLLTGPFEHLYSPLTHIIWFVLTSAIRSFGDASASTSALDASPFHATNLAVHVLSALVLFRLIGRLLPDLPTPLRLAGAGVFALHPIQVEAVTWVSGLKDLLCTAGMLSAMTLHAGELSRLSDPECGPSRYRPSRAVGVAAVALLALFSKPTAVVLPGLLLTVTAIHAAARGQEILPAFRRARMPLIGLAVVVVPFIAMTVSWQGASTHNTVSRLWRPVIVLDTLGHYISKVVWPFNFTLDYGRTMQFTIRDGHYIANALTFLGTLAVVAYLRDKVLWLALALFVLPLAPVSGITDFDFATISVVTDHYAYPALVGAGLFLVRLLQLVFTRWPALQAARNLPAIATSALLLFLASLAFSNANNWHTDADLDVHGLAVNPRSALLNSQFAALLHRDNKFDEALAHSLRALETWPAYPQAHYIAATSYAALNQPEKAVPHYVSALNSSSYNRRPVAYTGLADAYAELNKLYSASQLYRRALELDPKDVTALRMLPQVERELARRAAATRSTTARAATTQSATTGADAARTDR